MTTKYRVVYVRNGVPDPLEIEVVAQSPELAAQEAFGLDLVRSGLTHNLAANVYYQEPDQPVSMVRLYHRTSVAEEL